MATEKIILGIDPGTTIMGFGIIKVINKQMHFVRMNELMLKKYNEYQTTMGNLESEDLLFKAYMLGEYSFMDYYVELQFYRNASDKMLQMEKELQLLQAQLLKHQL